MKTILMLLVLLTACKSQSPPSLIDQASFNKIARALESRHQFDNKNIQKPSLYLDTESFIIYISGIKTKSKMYELAKLSRSIKQKEKMSKSVTIIFLKNDRTIKKTVNGKTKILKFTGKPLFKVKF